MCFELSRGSGPYLQGEFAFPVSFPWDSFGHKVSELLFLTIKVCHGDLGCSWRACSFVEISNSIAT
jgi:hypothetical protein